MKKNRSKKTNIGKTKNSYDKGQVFVKIMAGILAILMMTGTIMTLVYALMR